MGTITSWMGPGIFVTALACLLLGYYRGAIPFILLQMLVMLLIIVFPQLVTALPHLVV